MWYNHPRMAAGGKVGRLLMELKLACSQAWFMRTQPPTMPSVIEITAEGN